MNDLQPIKGVRPMRHFLGFSRYFILIAVVSSIVAAIALTIYGGLAVGSSIAQIAGSIEIGSITKKEVESYALEFISLIDIFLLSTVLYVVGLGLYELFVDSNIYVAEWMQIDSLEDLKDKLTGVVVVLIGVDFLGDYVESEGEISILWSGLSGAAIILALTVGLSWVTKRHHHEKSDGRGASDGGH